jgi:hypothetical protein
LLEPAAEVVLLGQAVMLVDEDGQNEFAGHCSCTDAFGQ